MKLLFVCSYGKNRSVTGAKIFADLGHETRYAGVQPNAERLLTTEDLEWADIVYVFEKNHRNRIHTKWPMLYRTKVIRCLYIEDVWNAHDPLLVDIIRSTASLM